MNHFTTPEFWEQYHRLPQEIRSLADRNYQLLVAEPLHPSLRFKSVGSSLWSVRIGLHYRALALREEDGYHWFWIGPHAEYEKLIAGA